MSASMQVGSGCVMIGSGKRARRWTLFDVCVFGATASLSFNMVGLDPNDILFPVLLVAGLALGCLRAENCAFPLALRTLAGAFVVLYAASNVVGQPVFGAVGHFVCNVTLLLVLKMYVRSQERMRKVMWGLLVGGLVSSGLSFAAVLKVVELPPTMFFPVREEESGKFSGLLADPPIIAVYSSLVALWMVDEIIRPKLWRRYGAGKMLVLAVCIVQVAATLSRSGWLNIGVSGLTFGLIEVWKKGFGRAAVLVSRVCVPLAVAILAVAGFEYKDVVKVRLQSVVDSTVYGYDESKRMEFYYTRQALEVALKNPWGVGSGRTETLFKSDETGLNLGAHNTFVQVLSDNGWATFCVFAVIVAYVGRSAWRSAVARKATQFGVSYQFVLSGLAGLAAEGMYHDLIGWSIAWFLPSMAAILLWPSWRGRGIWVEGRRMRKRGWRGPGFASLRDRGGSRGSADEFAKK
jgi:hypothetical protein